MDESRGPPQRRGAARETALRLTARRQFAGVQKAQATARQGRRDRNGRSKPAVDIATAWDGNPLPEGPGRDSAAGSVRSMTAPVPVREVARSQRNPSGNIDSSMKGNRNRNRNRNRNKQAAYYPRQKKNSHAGQKELSPGMRNIRPATDIMLQEWRYFLTSSSFLAYSGALLSGSCTLTWR